MATAAKALRPRRARCATAPPLALIIVSFLLLLLAASATSAAAAAPGATSGYTLAAEADRVTALPGAPGPLEFGLFAG